MANYALLNWIEENTHIEKFSIISEHCNAFSRHSWAISSQSRYKTSPVTQNPLLVYSHLRATTLAVQHHK